VTQQVSTVVIQLQLLELLLNDPVRLKETLVAARQSTQASLEELRSSVYELGPRLTDWDDLIGGLRSFAGDYSAQWGIDVEVKVDGAPRTVDGETTMLAYSVVQEGLSNVRKHAEADSVALEVQFGAAELKLGVKDDGAGFPVEAEGGRADSGLRLLRDRVQAAGGTLRVVSGPGTGTSLLVTLPLD
jgi:signal transduction histidine kinase